MSVGASVALAVAERVERTGGARAGLLAFRTLADKTADGAVRARALLGALRCALALRERRAVSDLTVLWETVEQGVWDEPVVALCKEMRRAGLSAEATALSASEARRHRTARSLYLHARCLELELGGAGGAATAFGEAIARASAEGAKKLEAAARVRRVVLHARSWDTLEAAIEEARCLDLAAVSVPSRLLVAAVLLHAPSRFVRAGALGALDAVACGDDAALATRALHLAARWADEVAASSREVTPVELDRLTALFGRERTILLAPRGRGAVRALERVLRLGDASARDEARRVEPTLGPLQERATELVGCRVEAIRDVAAAPAAPAERRAFRGQRILDVAAALRDRAPPRIVGAFTPLVVEAEAGELMPGELIGVAQLVLAGEDASARALAVRFFAAFLERPSYAAPPRGFLPLAEALAAAGEEALASTARRAAAVSKENGATESLGTALARAGWEDARSGDRDAAIAKLREAKALLDLGANRTREASADPGRRDGAR